MDSRLEDFPAPGSPLSQEIENQKRKALEAIEGYQIDGRIILALNQALSNIVPQLIPLIRNMVIEELKKDGVPIFWSTRP